MGPLRVLADGDGAPGLRDVAGRPDATPAPGRGSGRQGPRPRVARWLGLAVGYGAVLVGVAGLLLHLDSQFFDQQTLKNLVYTAPFAAPLAYAGVGLLLILDRMVDARLGRVGEVGRPAGPGRVHRQLRPEPDRPRAERLLLPRGMDLGGLLGDGRRHPGRGAARLRQPAAAPALRLGDGAQVVVGVLGALLHGRSNLARPRQSLREGFLNGRRSRTAALRRPGDLRLLERAMPVAAPAEVCERLP